MQAAFPDLRLSVVVLAERRFGVLKGSSTKARRQLALLADIIPVVPWTAEDAACYATIRLDLEQQGLPIGPMDLMIASQALRLGAVLVTRNEREFRRVRGLRVENWELAQE